MKSYLGVKLVDASPMDASQAIIKDYKIGSAKDADPGYEVIYRDGYKAWCPKTVFDEANRPVDAMSFGHAVEALKKGMKVARAGWNGKGMWLRLYDPYLDKQFPICEQVPSEGTPIQWIGMKTADGKFVPWLASQTDVLADDWSMVVE